MHAVRLETKSALCPDLPEACARRQLGRTALCGNMQRQCFADAPALCLRKVLDSLLAVARNF